MSTPLATFVASAFSILTRASRSSTLPLPRESDGDGRRNPTDLKAQESRRPLEAAFFLRCPILGF